LIPTFQANYLYPLEKDSKNFKNTLTPKLSLRLSPNNTKNLRKTDRTIDYNNIFDFERLSVRDAVEGGFSATYGYEYIKSDKLNSEQKIKFGLANNLRINEEKDLPANSNLGGKTSDFVGIFEYNPKQNIKLNYDFSLKNNLEDKNYELYGFEFFLNNFNTKFEYVNENHTSLKNSYLTHQTSYNFNEKNSLTFETRENKEQSFTEFYNLIYQYQNDCLTAGIEYSKDYYSDQDLKPNENLLFKISIIPLGGINTPNLKK
jgi:LPS-assembly protein